MWWHISPRSVHSLVRSFQSHLIDSSGRVVRRECHERKAYLPKSSRSVLINRWFLPSTIMISPNCVTLEDRFMQSSRYTGLPMDERGSGIETVVCRVAGDAVSDGVAETPCLIAVDVEGLEFGEVFEALVAVFCGEDVAPVVDDVPGVVVVFRVVSTTKPCC